MIRIEDKNNSNQITVIEQMRDMRIEFKFKMKKEIKKTIKFSHIRKQIMTMLVSITFSL